MFADHILHGRVVVPGAGYLEMVSSACLQAAGAVSAVACLTGALFLAPLVLGGDAMVIECECGRRGQFEVRSGAAADAAELTKHCVGDYASAGSVATEHGSGAPPADAMGVDVLELYRVFATLGLQYGPDYRRVSHAWTCEDPSVVLALLRACDAFPGVPIHPADVDAAVQLSLLPRAGEQELRLPFAVEQVLVATVRGGYHPTKPRRELWAVSLSPPAPLLACPLPARLRARQRVRHVRLHKCAMACWWK